MVDFFLATLHRLKFPIAAVDVHISFIKRIVDIPYLPAKGFVAHHMLAVTAVPLTKGWSNADVWGSHVLRLQNRNKVHTQWKCSCGKTLSRDVCLDTPKICDDCGKTYAADDVMKYDLFPTKHRDRSIAKQVVQICRKIVDTPRKKKFRRIKVAQLQQVEDERLIPLLQSIGFVEDQTKDGDEILLLSAPKKEGGSVDAIALEEQCDMLKAVITSLRSHAFDLYLNSLSINSSSGHLSINTDSTTGTSSTVDTFLHQTFLVEWLRELGFCSSDDRSTVEMDNVTTLYTARHRMETPTATTSAALSRTMTSDSSTTQIRLCEELVVTEPILTSTHLNELSCAVAALELYKQDCADEARGDSADDNNDRVSLMGQHVSQLRQILPASANAAFQRRLPYYSLIPPETDYNGCLRSACSPLTRLIRCDEMRSSSTPLSTQLENHFVSPPESIGIAKDNLYASLTRSPIVCDVTETLPPVLVFKVERPSRCPYEFTFDNAIWLHPPYVTNNADGSTSAFSSLVDGTLEAMCYKIESLAATQTDLDSATALCRDARDAIKHAAQQWGGRYDLRAVVVHKTNHYTCFVRSIEFDDGSDENHHYWTEFDDDHVETNIPLEKAQKIWFGGEAQKIWFGGTSYVETQARMLFYERASTNSESVNLSATDDAVRYVNHMQKMLSQIH